MPDDLFGDAPTEPDRQMCIHELKREISVRKNVFPNWVLNRRLTQEVSDFRIACLEKAVELLQE